MASDRRKRRNRRKLRIQAPKQTPVHFVRLKLPRVEISTERKWFVVRTMAQMDNRVRDGLHDIGAETYLPILVEERIRRNKRVEWPQRPLAGYVFAGIIGGSPMALGHCEGAIEVLTLDGQPVEVPTTALQAFADHVTGCNEERREALAATRQKIKLRGLETLKRIRYFPNQDEPSAVLALNEL
jgi:hypothetical protein